MEQNIEIGDRVLDQDNLCGWVVTNRYMTEHGVRLRLVLDNMPEGRAPVVRECRASQFILRPDWWVEVPVEQGWEAVLRWKATSSLRLARELGLMHLLDEDEGDVS